MNAATQSAPSPARRYVVMCTRQDGGEREFARYNTIEEAARVAEHLRKVGCAARVDGNAEPSDRAPLSRG